MILDRRTFLLGAASVIAAQAIPAQAKFIGEVATGVLDSRLPYRSIQDIMFSFMATGAELKSPAWVEDPVRITILRNDIPTFNLMLNPRATFRWVAMPGGGIIVLPTDTLRVVVEPSHTYASLCLMSDIERDQDPRIRRRVFSESFSWKDGICTLSAIAALDPADASVLADA